MKGCGVGREEQGAPEGSGNGGNLCGGRLGQNAARSLQGSGLLPPLPSAVRSAYHQELAGGLAALGDGRPVGGAVSGALGCNSAAIDVGEGGQAELCFPVMSSCC